MIAKRPDPVLKAEIEEGLLQAFKAAVELSGRWGNHYRVRALEDAILGAIVLVRDFKENDPADETDMFASSAKAAKVLRGNAEAAQHLTRAASRALNQDI